MTNEAPAGTPEPAPTAVKKKGVSRIITPILALVAALVIGLLAGVLIGHSTASTNASPRTGFTQGQGFGGSGKKLKAEFNSLPHVRGVCSMARSQNPDSADSQFFICFADARFLDNQYTAWGNVVEGMENVDALPKGEPPREPGKIVTMRVLADVTES